MEVREAADLWDLEEWLGRRPKEIDREYEYLHSVSLDVFTVLIGEENLRFANLEGLGADIFLWLKQGAVELLIPG